MSRCVEFIVDHRSSPMQSLARLPWLWLSFIRSATGDGFLINNYD
jgi:hypothetical protein